MLEMTDFYHSMSQVFVNKGDLKRDENFRSVMFANVYLIHGCLGGCKKFQVDCFHKNKLLSIDG